MKLWPLENLVVIAVLVGTVYLYRLPWDMQTIGWMMGAFAAHSARSHAGRLREDAGRPVDWTSTWIGCLGGLGVLMAARASQAVLVGVPVAVAVIHFAYRQAYRSWKPAIPAKKPALITRSNRRTH